ncbi:lasso peptide biosynthesis PqqD family chaperone [Spongiactinospora sp. TRM90649]|uniref:lasso peptide biosynthesis PqqD family chaperone n=1 Tax=Spongiactinospora sp. TRM90649 TaxID=3031114 RepID=UPI0023F97645|nr:lasso peptide biosynthesis PqqD family chaperone [Spongiactinospora sp. TRM90649]MDF5752459.1 lasso peptide biosynthesis PqqD family chaperone [Spongiactinospora sp. TRM90649]
MAVILCGGVSLSHAPGGTVLLDERAGRYRQLNATGALILRALLDGDTPEEAARRLVRRHPGLTRERAGGDVENLLADLRTARLVASP